MKKHHIKKSVMLTATLLGTLQISNAWSTDSILGLGTLGGGFSNGAGVSADGSVVVGSSYLSDGTTEHAFRWTSTGGMVDIGSLGGTVSYANGVSADGLVVVGSSYLLGGTDYHAFKWASGHMTDLLTLGGTSSYAYGTSFDGSVIVGASQTSGDTSFHAVKWSSAGMTDLLTLGGSYSIATGVSGNGDVIVGWSNTTGDLAAHAFKWSSTGMADLSTLGGTRSYAYGVSSDGLVIVGVSQTAGDAVSHPFRWDSSGMSDLGVPIGYTDAFALAASSDGNVVVGNVGINCSACGGGPAFRWSTSTGMELVSTWLSRAGVSLGPLSLISATAVSADGSVVIGTADQPTGPLEPYIARVSSIGSGLINPTVYLQSVFTSAQTYRNVGSLTSLPMNGAHHRPLMSYKGIAGDKCAWATGDFANRDSGSGSRIGMGEVGVCGDFMNNSIRAGIGIGQSYMSQDLDYSGKSKLDGKHVVAEVDWKVPDSNLLLSSTALYGQWDVKISRGYQNGGISDHSNANTNASSASLRGRLDWLDAASFGSLSVTPWTSFTATRAKVDAYTEIGGGFPAKFDKQNRTAYELRIGVTGETIFSEKTTIRGNVEAVHRLDKSDPYLSGEALGLFTFRQPGLTQQQNWARIGVDIDRKLTNASLISLSLNTSSSGMDANVSGAVSYHMAF